jgi:hypothetical protein
MWKHLQLHLNLALVRYICIEHGTTILPRYLDISNKDEDRVGLELVSLNPVPTSSLRLAVILPFVCVTTTLHGKITLIIHLKKLQSFGLFPTQLIGCTAN